MRITLKVALGRLPLHRFISKHSLLPGGLLCGCCLVILLASSCSDESDMVPADWVPASFSPRIAGSTSGSTRVVDQTWSGNEVVGIHMVAAGSSDLPQGAAFSQYKPSTTTPGTSVSLIPTSADQTIYYPYDGSNVHFYAFSPYAAPSDNGVTYAVTDQSSRSGMESADFIWARTTTGTYNKNNRTVEMTFDHKQSKIVLHVTAGTGITADDMADATLTIQGIPTSGTYSLSDGSLQAAATSGTVTPYCSASGEDESPRKITWEAILVPHAHDDENFASRKLVFTFNGKTITYTLPTDSQSFEAGKSHVYHLTLSTTAIVLNSLTINDWNVVKSITYGEPSNSYILKPGGYTVAIPVSRANEFAQQLGENEAFTAKLLWNDGSANLITLTKSTGTGYKDYICVTSNDDKTKVGNALITVAKSSAPSVILWSWHIWVTDYEPDATKTFMDRNLGAASGTVGDGVKAFGLLYQWGRPAPFPGSAGLETTAGEEPTLYNAAGEEFQYGMSTTALNPTKFNYITLWKGQTTMDYALKNPHCFFAADYSWMSGSTAIDDPWGEKTSKTIYDPCPAGWRVPKGNPWSELTTGNFPWTNTNLGCTSSTHGGWYPATGYRDIDSAFYLVGNSGACWRSTISSVTHAYCFLFSSTSVNSIANGRRATALSIRCSAEY